ncbi:MAG: sigma-70 family RNA polymerase sigma factor [Bacteroidales bacterium]
MSKVEDFSLIAQVLVFGNKQAYNQLVIKYQSSVRRFLLHLTGGNEELCDDLAQETFLKAYINLQSFKGMAQFHTWLFRIAYNLFYDYLRKQKELYNEEIEEVKYASTIDENKKYDLNHDLKAALHCLNPEERVVVLLYYMEDLSVGKIAGITKFPENTVKSHLHRGRSKMKFFLKQFGYESDNRR